MSDKPHEKPEPVEITRLQVLNLTKSVLKHVDTQEQCTAIVKKEYLIEYGRSGRKTWAIEITTTADKFYVAHIFPSDDKQNPWSVDTGWIPKHLDKSPKFDLSTTYWTSVGDAIETAVAGVTEIVIHQAMDQEYEAMMEPMLPTKDFGEENAKS